VGGSRYVPGIGRHPRRELLSRDLAASVGMALDADICILNFYEAGGRMGLHQDKVLLPRGRSEGLRMTPGKRFRRFALSHGAYAMLGMAVRAAVPHGIPPTGGYLV
jgi:hypothetical protein